MEDFLHQKANGNSIFIPTVGSRLLASYGSLPRDEGSEADVWPSMLNTVGVDYGQCLYFLFVQYQPLTTATVTMGFSGAWSYWIVQI